MWRTLCCNYADLSFLAIWRVGNARNTNLISPKYIFKAI